jgi:uncharacterized iron-regulated membrane protein
MAARWITFTRWSRTFHRWIAYGTGVAVALWTVTGIVMLLPPAQTTLTPRPATIDAAAAARSPAEAAKALPDDHPPVRSVTLRDLAGRLVFQFMFQNGRHEFVDATTGQHVAFNDSLAAALARRVLPDTTMLRAMFPIAAHDARYPFGVLPAFRIELGDARRTLVHVAGDGSVTSTSNRSRFRAFMGGLHEFQLPGQLVPDRPRKALLLGAGLLTFVLIVTGYVLTLPARRNRKSAPALSPDAT